MSKKSSLGRGLDALLDRPVAGAAGTVSSGGVPTRNISRTAKAAYTPVANETFAVTLEDVSSW